jgi:hypothetical protein
MILEAESFEPRPILDEQLAREVAEAEAMAGSPAPKVIRSSKFFAKAMNVEEAVMQMNLQGQDFLVFMNEASREVNVVYKRSDGNYGLIETGEPAEGEGAIVAAKAGGEPGPRAGSRQPA